MTAGRAAVDRAEPANLVFISTGLDAGGAETMLYRLATRCDPSRFRIGVVSLTGKGEIGGRLEAAGIPVVALNLPRGRVPWQGIRRLLEVVRAFDADLLQGWMYHGNLAASSAGWISRRPCRVLWGVRQCLYDATRERPLTRGVIRACANLSWQPAAVLYNSQVSRRQHEAFGFASDRSIVVPNGFELSRQKRDKKHNRRLLGLPTDRVLVGLIARYHPCKGHATFLAAASLVAQRCPEAGFVMAGRDIDSRNDRLARLATSLGIADRVCLLGHQQDAARLIESLDVLCVASTWGDSFPNVVGEAMAARIPCVVTDVGDAAEIVGYTGLVVAPGDAPALAQALETMIRCGPAARAELGAAAQRRVAERYSLEAVVAQYEQVYEEVCGNVRYRGAL